MGKTTSLIGGLGLGAVAIYLLDPDRGGTRRAILRDKLNAVWHVKLRAKDAMLKDARNRLTGALAGAASRFERSTPDDEKLVARIRSEAGHLISHPRALRVEASGGCVALSGDILAEEVEPLVRAIWEVPGVTSVEHRLLVHEEAESIPSLQGDVKEFNTTPDLLREQWSPGTALAAGAIGGLLALYGFTRRGPTGTTLGVLGLGVLAKGFRDAEGTAMVQKLGRFA
jgi:hypothetical protein